MITLIHTKHGIKFVPHTESLYTMQSYLLSGYKLAHVDNYSKCLYISVEDGKFWIRPGNASDTEPRMRVNRTTNNKPGRATLSVPRKWITSQAIDIGTALHNQLLTADTAQLLGACNMKLAKIKLQASGFEPKYFDTRNWQINQLLYELSLGNTCLVLPMIVEFGDAKGFYIHQRINQFELTLGNSSMRMPHLYENNRSLWVPKDFIATTLSTNQQPELYQTEELPMDLVSLVMAEELFAITVEFSKGGQRYTYKSQKVSQRTS